MLQTQVWAQLVDVYVDKEAGRTTTAVLLGVLPTRLLLAGVMAGEVLYVWTSTTDVRGLPTQPPQLAALTLAAALSAQMCLRAFTCGAMALPMLSSAVPKGAAGKAMAAQLHVLGYAMNGGGVGLLCWCWARGVFR